MLSLDHNGCVTTQSSLLHEIAVEWLDGSDPCDIHCALIYQLWTIDYGTPIEPSGLNKMDESLMGSLVK